MKFKPIKLETVDIKYLFLVFGFLSVILGVLRYRFEAIIFGLIMLAIAAFEAHNVES